MPSPAKPWETAAANTRVATVSNSGVSTNTTSNTPPAVPARPSTSTSSGYGYANRGYATASGYNTGYNPYSSYSSYNSYGGGYGTPYNRYGSSYSSYSPYNRYGYGSYGYGPYNHNRFGYGGVMGPGGPGGPEEMSLTQRMEANTAAGFHMIESVVGAFGGFSQMLESTFFATHSSFMAMVGVVEQFGNLRNYLGQVLSIFAVIRWVRHLWYRITGKRPPVNPNELTPSSFQQYQETARYSRRPILLFILAVFGVPYLMHKFVQIISRRHQEQHGSIPPGNNSEIIPAPMTQTNSSPQNHEFCRALHDFKGESSIELSFDKGEIIAILCKTDVWGNLSPWWRGRLRNGEHGMFPSNYIEIINKGGNPEGSKDVKGLLSSNNNNNNNVVNNDDKEFSVEEFENRLRTTKLTLTS